MADKTTPLRLRALEPSDTDLLYIWENNPEMWHYGASSAPLSRQQIWEYIDRYDANPIATGQLRLMIQAGEETVGAIDLYDLDIKNRRAYVGIMIATPHRRRGYALQALALIESYCITNLGLHQLAATVAESNTPSLELFHKAGFATTATLPEWVRIGSDTFESAHILTKKI
jgi:diamine N-acetyltransferase